MLAPKYLSKGPSAIPHQLVPTAFSGPINTSLYWEACACNRGCMSDTVCPSSHRRTPAAKGAIWCGRFFCPDPSFGSMPTLPPLPSHSKGDAIHPKTVVRSSSDDRLVSGSLRRWVSGALGGNTSSARGILTPHIGAKPASHAPIREKLINNLRTNQ